MLFPVLLFVYFLLILPAGSVLPVVALNNGLALSPPLGWSTWNTFRCDYDESDIRDMADILISSGLAGLGYRYLNIDDCWEAAERDTQGQLQYNSTKFPSGMTALADYIHSKGLYFGLYTSSGPYTCQGYPGSWLYEEEDAKLFASWRVDYLKLDCCYQFNVSDRSIAFTAMSKALNETGRSIVFSCDSDELLLLENNEEYPVLWAPPLCNLARIHWDIYDSWTSIMSILDAAINVNQYSQSGYWNDLDILTVGMGQQSIIEYTTHFQFWCIISSPLIMGHDLRTMNESILEILSNQEAVAINQDPLHRAANIIQRSLDGSKEIWAKPLYQNNNKSSHYNNNKGSQTYKSHNKKYRTDKNRVLNNPPSQNLAGYITGSSISLPVPDFHPWPYHAVLLFNRADSIYQDLYLDFLLLFDNALCPHPQPPAFTAMVRDAWNHKDLGIFSNNYTAKHIPPHGSVLLTIRLIQSM